MRPLLLLVLTATPMFAQTYTQRGFLEGRGTFYPQTTSKDRAHGVGEALFRYEGIYTPYPFFQVAGALEFRTDTHHQVERDFKLSWQDREVRRPAGEVRRLSATYHRGPLTFEAGKQFIRWGKTDIVTPTDRFAPRDFLTVVDNEFLAVTAARVNYEKGSDTVEVVWSPRLTPSRMPLADQRWGVPSESPAAITSDQVEVNIPGGPQSGIRWNHAGAVEYEVAVYRGFNNLPSFGLDVPVVLPQPTGTPRSPGFQVFYPKLTMLGGDVAVPTQLFTMKAEAAYFSSATRGTDEYVLYVVQIERQSGEWLFVGGYAGESITNRRSDSVVFNPGSELDPSFSVFSQFAPDRGLAKTVVARAGYTIDANRSIAMETAIRQDGKGLWLKGEYSHAIGQHWRGTLNLTLIRGEPGDFLGQYRRNSHALFILRYSF